MKGRTRIELMRDGKLIKAVEHSNTFQAETVQKQLRSLGAFNNTYPFNAEKYQTATWKELLGGVYLFDRPIENGTEYAPADAVMTGNGAFEYPAGGAEEMGAWEAANFVENKDSIQMSWTWTESQGNGNIRSVCLGNVIGGFIGYGNNSGTKNGSGKTIDSNQKSGSYTVGNDIKQTPGYFPIFHNNCIYTADLMRENTSSVKIYKKHLSIENAEFFQGSNSASNEEIEIPYRTPSGEATTMPTMSHGYEYFNAVDDSHWIGMYSSSDTVGATGRFIATVIDIEARTATVHSVQNNTDDTIGYRWNSGGGIKYGVAPLTKNKLLAKGTYKHHLWIIDIETSEARCITEGYNVTSTTPDTSEFRLNMSAAMPGRVMLHDDAVDDKFYYILDIENETIKPVNLTWDRTAVLMEGHDFIYNQTSGRAIKVPFYLGTINNLPETITKDSTMTMRIIYTINREEDD